MALKRLSAVPKKPQEDDTSSRIVAAATQLFATKGYEGTSTKEICDAAEVNVAAVHYHFGSKEELYRHIIESFGGVRLKSVRRILEPPDNPEELKIRLQMFLEEAIEPFLQQPEVCKIIQTVVELLHARSEDVFRGTFLKLFETLVDFLSHARKRGLISKNVEPRFAARCLYSQICHQTRSDNVYLRFYDVSLRQSAYRRTWIEQTLCIFLGGVSNTGAIPSKLTHDARRKIS